MVYRPGNAIRIGPWLSEQFSVLPDSKNFQKQHRILGKRKSVRMKLRAIVFHASGEIQSLELNVKILETSFNKFLIGYQIGNEGRVGNKTPFWVPRG